MKQQNLALSASEIPKGSAEAGRTRLEMVRFDQRPISKSVGQLGFWSAVVVAMASVAFDGAFLVGHRLAAPWDVIAPLAPSLVLAPAFLALLVCVHSSVRDEVKIWTRLAVAFAGVYVPLCSTAYIVEMLVVQPLVLRGQADRVALLTLTRGGTVLNAVDGLGYIFMSLATLCAAPAFAGGRVERWIRWLFLANGILAVPIFLTYFVNPLFIYVAGPWGITIPGSTILLAIYFRRYGHGEDRQQPQVMMDQVNAVREYRNG